MGSGVCFGWCRLGCFGCALGTGMLLFWLGSGLLMVGLGLGLVGSGFSGGLV